MTYLAAHSKSIAPISQGGSISLHQEAYWTHEFGTDMTVVSLWPRLAKVSEEPLLQAYELGPEENLQWEMLSGFTEHSLNFPKTACFWENLQWPWEMLEVSLNSSRIKRCWNMQRTSAVFLLEFQLQLLETYYVVRDAEVRQILRRHPSLVQLLLDTYSKITLHFPNSQVFLDTTIDPEMTDVNSEMLDDNEELVVYISTDLSSEEAIENLKKFYNTWWLKASREAKGKISVGLEFL